MTSANEGISVTINEHSTESVSAQKHLGITIDKSLTWEQQIYLVCRSVSRKLTLMKVLSKYVNQNSLKQYHNSCSPRIDFGCVVWGTVVVAFFFFFFFFFVCVNENETETKRKMKRKRTLKGFFETRFSFRKRFSNVLTFSQ